MTPAAVNPLSSCSTKFKKKNNTSFCDVHFTTKWRFCFKRGFRIKNCCSWGKDEHCSTWKSFEQCPRALSHSVIALFCGNLTCLTYICNLDVLNSCCAFAPSVKGGLWDSEGEINGLWPFYQILSNFRQTALQVIPSDALLSPQTSAWCHSQSLWRHCELKWRPWKLIKLVGVFYEKKGRKQLTHF